MSKSRCADNYTAYVVITGAFERDNFGDILFGELLSEVLSGIPLINASIISSPMYKFGSGPVLPLLDFAVANKSHPPIMIINAGGEVLTCSLHNAILMDLPSDISHYIYNMDPSIVERLFNAMTKDYGPLGYIWGTSRLKPWDGYVIRTEAISAGGVDDRILGATKQSTYDLKCILKSLDRIEVRDPATKYALERNYGIESELSVDIVFAIRRFCWKAIEQAEFEINSETKTPYIVVQISSFLQKEISTDIFNKVAHQIREVAKHINCEVVVQPAGLAAFHDDAGFLIKLAAAIGIDGVVSRYEPDRNVWRQVARISKSKLYIGSSLHGRIIASTAAVPAISLSGSKVLENCRHWGVNPSTFDVSLEQIASAAHAVLGIDRQVLLSDAVGLCSRASASLLHLRDRVRREIGIRAFATEAEITQLSLAGLLAESQRLRRELGELAIWAEKSKRSLSIRNYEILKSELYLLAENAILDRQNNIELPPNNEEYKMLAALRSIMDRLIKDNEISENNSE